MDCCFKKGVILVPFEDDDAEVDVPITNKAGTIRGAFFSGKNGKSSKEQFEKSANEANDRANAYKDRAAALASSFKKILDDKTLAPNKNIFSKDLEKEVISRLVQLAIDMNTDENEMEGMGSVGLITLLLRTSVILRDRVNSLEYNLSVLEKKIKDLESDYKKGA